MNQNVNKKKFLRKKGFSNRLENFLLKKQCQKTHPTLQNLEKAKINYGLTAFTEDSKFKQKWQFIILTILIDTSKKGFVLKS